MDRFLWLWRPLGLLLLAGCGLPTRGDIDPARELADRIDRLDAHAARDSVPANPAAPAVMIPAPPAPADAPGPVRPVGRLEQEKPPAEKPRKLVIPPDLPGSDAPPIKLPEDKTERSKYVKELYPPLPALPPFVGIAPGPEGHPLSLGDLQRFAVLYSPAIKSAREAVEAAEGAAKQAGAYPNPTFGFENDTLQTGPAGYVGFFANQVIKTGGKLKLQEAAALMDVLSARLALRKAHSDLAYQVRTNYFAVLVAQENVRVNESLFRLTHEAYQVQVDYLDKGVAAGYEPMQLRPLALQARLNLIQARNQYLASWRQLVAAMGLRDMPPSELAGRVDLPIPHFDYEEVRRRVLNNHTDVLTAYASLQKAQYALELAKLVPLPDVTVNVIVQKDYTTPPNQIATSVQVGVPVPIWDQNAGGIRQAEALVRQAAIGPDQARNTLLGTLADAFNRYQTNQDAVEISLQQVRDQLRAYRGQRARWEQDPANVAFNDLVTSQQTLAGYIAAYVTALGQQWQAVVDVANLLQTDDLFQAGPCREVVPIPEMEQLSLPAAKKPAAVAPDQRDAEATGRTFADAKEARRIEMRRREQ
jgi:cobalt-zinc-cadmium efflux system outer membrane protein